MAHAPAPSRPPSARARAAALAPPSAPPSAPVAAAPPAPVPSTSPFFGLSAGVSGSRALAQALAKGQGGVLGPFDSSSEEAAAAAGYRSLRQGQEGIRSLLQQLAASQPGGQGQGQGQQQQAGSAEMAQLVAWGMSQGQGQGATSAVGPSQLSSMQAQMDGMRREMAAMQGAAVAQLEQGRTREVRSRERQQGRDARRLLLSRSHS